MATVRTLPWYAPPRVARAVRQVETVSPGAARAAHVPSGDPGGVRAAGRAVRSPEGVPGQAVEATGMAAGRHHRASAGHRQARTRHPEPDDLRRPGFPHGVPGGDLRRRHRRHRPGADVGLLRGLGGLADHAPGGHLAIVTDDLAGAGPGRRGGPELRDGDHRPGGAPLGALCPAGPRGNPQHQGAGLHRESARRGGIPHPHHDPLHLSQRRQLPHRPGDAPGGIRHSSRISPELPRRRASPSHPGVGPHDRGRARADRHRLVGLDVPGSGHHVDRALPEPAGRLAPRSPGPQAPHV